MNDITVMEKRLRDRLDKAVWLWSLADRYAASHSRLIGAACKCPICKEFGDLDWNISKAAT